MRVVVVGAGLAGLRAAQHLTAAGADVVLVEGGVRPGGRVRTVRDVFTGGQYSESGAEWVDDHHHRMLELLDRFGVRTLGVGEQWTVIRRWLHHGGRLLDPAAIRAADPGVDEQFARFDEIIDAVTEGVADANAPHLHPQAAEVDAQSLALGEVGAEMVVQLRAVVGVRVEQELLDGSAVGGVDRAQDPDEGHLAAG